MASISRRLHKHRNGDKLHLIFIVSFGRHYRWDISSQVKLEEIYWTQNKRVNTKFPEEEKFNNYLDNTEALIKSKSFELLQQDGGEIDRQVVQNALNHLILGLQVPEIRTMLSNEKPKQTFFGFAEQYILESSATKTHGTIKTYRQAINRLKDYNPNLDFEDFNIAFYYDFVRYLTIDLSINNNTVGKHIKVLKSMLNEATERDLNTNMEYRKKKFKVLREEVDSVYLTVEEIRHLFNFREQLTPAKRRVCDLFLIGCNTGLRFSDLSNLNKANIYADESGSFILQRTRKTGQQVVIPINSMVKEIMDTYETSLPKALSNQKANKAIKEICEKAGFTKEIETKNKIGATQVTRISPKHELISTHTARRSFATNAFLSGVPVLSLMKITGHKTERAFMQYIKASQLDNAMVIAKHPFFK